MLSRSKEIKSSLSLLRSLMQPLLGLWQRRAIRAFSLLFTAGLGLSLALAACSPTAPEASTSPSASSSPTQTITLRIGHQKFDPLTLVKNRGNLEERLKPLGVASVEWTEFQAGPPMLEALNVGSIDIARTGDAPPVIAQAADAPLLYVGGSEPKDKSSAVLVKKDSPIQTVADLKGRKVALAKGSSANYLIVKVLESNGLKWEDIEPAYLSPADARSAFEQGSVDAWAIWDPFYAAAQAKADVRVLRDSEGLVANRDFYLSNKTFAADHPEVINAIREETQAVADWASKNPEEVAELLSPILGIDKSVLEVVTNRRNYGFESITPDMVAEQQAIADTFYTLKLIPKAIKVDDVVWQPS